MGVSGLFAGSEVDLPHDATKVGYDYPAPPHTNSKFFENTNSKIFVS